MRLKVLIVDDEPAAIKYLLTIFQEYLKDFEIADIAQDGEEALKKIEKSEPDIVITDIKMPLCNGLDLVSKAKIKFPDIEYVLISGYKDFEYAQRAIREGVCDYVLKPIDVDSFVNLLNHLKEKIEKKYYDKQILLLKKIIADIKIDEKEIKKFLPWDKYFLCILREGGIPLKYSSKTKFINEINFETASEISPSKFKNALYWQFFGRDDKELILVTPDTGNKLTAVELFKKIFESKKDGGLYFTSVIVDYSFELFQLKDMLMKTLRFLDLNIVLGYTQIIHYNTNNSSSTLLNKESDINQREIEKKFSYYISNLMVESLEKELERVLDKLKEQKVPLIIVSSLFRNVIIFAAEQLNSEMKRYDIEYILDELISTSKDYNELKSGILDILNEIINKNVDDGKKKNSRKLIDSIKKYIDNNISEQLSVQKLCEIFDISPTYLNILFRKFENTSFTKYLTHRRVDKAKELMTNNPQLSVKDISELLGYSDQFYFSKVFKSVVGVSPSEFKENIQQRKKDSL